jgi:hypothetical protein
MGLENSKNLTDATNTKAVGHQVEQHKLIQNPKQACDEYKQMTLAVKGAITETGKFWQGMHDGMHEFVDETGQSLAVARDYYGEALKGQVNLGADIKEFGGAIGNSSGQALGTAGDYYFNQVPKGQANLGNDIGQAHKAAVDHWNSLDTEHKGQFFGKQVVPLMVPGALGIVAKEVQGANLIGKAGQVITSFRGAQLIPVYAEGFAPARAIAAANVGQITGDGTDLTLPGMLLMSQAKGDSGSQQPNDKTKISANPYTDGPDILFKQKKILPPLTKEQLEEIEKEFVTDKSLQLSYREGKLDGYVINTYGDSILESFVQRDILKTLEDNGLKRDKDFELLGPYGPHASCGNSQEICVFTQNRDAQLKIINLLHKQYRHLMETAYNNRFRNLFGGWD